MINSKKKTLAKNYPPLHVTKTTSFLETGIVSGQIEFATRPEERIQLVDPAGDLRESLMKHGGKFREFPFAWSILTG